MRSLAAMASSSQKDLFSSVIVNIKNYTGDDPLRPWIQGIRRIHQSLPPHVLHEKLPRFLQKCAQTFESDRRYRNDSRYLSVWIQLMDYVDDAKKLLKKMKNEQIGVKRAKFYIAYALYYEKKKKFKDAENMYQLGAQKLSGAWSPASHHCQVRITLSPSSGSVTMCFLKGELVPRNQSPALVEQLLQAILLRKSLIQKITNKISSPNHHAEEYSCRRVDKNLARSHTNPAIDLHMSDRFYKDDPGLTRDGLLDPTISPGAQVPETISRGLNQVKPKLYKHQCSIEVLADEEMEEPGHGNHVFTNAETSGSPKKTGNTGMQKPFVGAFKILADDDEEGDDGDDNDDSDNDDDDGDDDDEDEEIKTKSYDVRLNEDTVIRRLKEDTVIRKFVGSTVFDEPKFENACHHGLVDPTVNLKQAMDDINGMFGKPLNFVRTGKSKKEDKRFGRPPDVSNQAFFILADEDSERDVKAQAPPHVSRSSMGEGDFFEPTIFTKEAMNEINDLFGKPLDF